MNWDNNVTKKKELMLEKNEKVYLSILVISTIVLIFTAIYISNRCPDCDKTYSKNKNPNQSIVVYRIG